MMTKKRLLILLVISLPVFIILSFFFGLQNREPGSEQPGEEVGITVDNISSYASQLRAEDIGAEIQVGLSSKLAGDQPDATRLYHANVRDKSFVKQANAEGTPYYSFLVDIPKLKRTYKVTFQGGDDYDQNILYVVCAESSELVWPAQPCKGIE